MVLLYTALGGAAGAIARYLLSVFIHSRYSDMFPWGTFAVNSLACLLLGVVFALSLQTGLISDRVRALFIIGFLGSFSTFSTLIGEGWNMLREGSLHWAFMYLTGSFFAGLLAFALGTAAVALVIK